MTDLDVPTELDDIQGLVFSGWTDHPHAGFLFARLGDAARARRWLADLIPQVTRTPKARRPAAGRLQVAISATGLAALGVPDDVVAMLPREVAAGMARRQRALADSDPAGWELGGPDDPLDVVVMIYARDAAARGHAIDRQRAALVAAGATVRPAELSCTLMQREHFGFADGLSQPFLAGLHPESHRGEDQIATGEILLGYRNAYDRVAPTPHWGDVDLGRNGTYLVFRKLEQDVAGLWGWVAAQARRLAASPAEAEELTELIAAKLVGRWKSGASLALAPDADDPAFAAPDQLNAFNYLRHDADGLRCPIASHVRRANPRDARGGSHEQSKTVVNRHRIVRRGRSYGEPMDLARARTGVHDGTSRGLYFLCLQASVARGFEFIQQTWLANPGFLGLHREPDPIIGNRAGTCHLTIPAAPLRLRLTDVPAIVTNRGGGYFLLPSLTALARLARA
jgi:Dyp-type peroxidase family